MSPTGCNPTVVETDTAAQQPLPLNAAQLRDRFAPPRAVVEEIAVADFTETTLWGAWLRVVLFRHDSAPVSGAGTRPQRTNGEHPMKDPTVRGVVHLIEETKTFGQKGFRKRLVVLEQSKGTFTNFIPVEFVKDGCDAVDDLSVGDEIEVTYRLSGRRWQRDEASEAKYFLSAEGLSFKRLSGGGRASDGVDDAIDPNDAFAEAGNDDVPF